MVPSAVPHPSVPGLEESVRHEADKEQVLPYGVTLSSITDPEGSGRTGMVSGLHLPVQLVKA